jgi:hypothetical protein
MARAFALPALVMAVGCSRAAPPDFWLVLDTAPETVVLLAHAEVSPPDALIDRRAERGGVALRLRRDLGPVRVNASGACPVVVETPQAAPPVVERHVDPLFDLGPHVRVVGPARRFEIRPKPHCGEAKRARIDFRVAGGAPLDDVRLEDGGRTFSARTRGIDRVRLGSEWGIVPVSANERGVTEIVARIRSVDGWSFERRFEVAALTRASGLPSVALGHGVLLSGSGFRLAKKPEGSRAELRLLGDLAELVPDVRGDFALADARGRELVIQGARYDEMPLDCGRSDCHSAIAASVRDSPMTHALSDGPEREHLRNQCAVTCHATGEPGTGDGGFSHVQEELGLVELPANWTDLPRALRRVGGVGCLACHGPTAIPPESARWAVLSSDVCAVCHDAPPRYRHVAAFNTTKMARADRNELTREPGCARCHTAWGWLGEPERRPPAHVGALGIGCVACHDVHPRPDARAGEPGQKHTLLREIDVSAVLPGAPTSATGRSRVCISCHSPGAEPFPAASAAAVWAGRGGLDPETGDPLAWPAPHAKNETGCLHCHAEPREGFDPRYIRALGVSGRGGSHAFRATLATCVACHDETPKRRPALAARARAVLDELVPLVGGKTRPVPIHAEALEVKLTGEKARALRNVLLVLEDGAADVHNPAYAEMLVSSAENALNARKPPKRRPEEAPP